MRHWKKFLVAGIVLVVSFAVVPIASAAVSTPDVISVLGAVINGVIAAGRDGYCAVGVTAFCP